MMARTYVKFLMGSNWKESQLGKESLINKDPLQPDMKSGGIYENI